MRRLTPIFATAAIALSLGLAQWTFAEEIVFSDEHAGTVAPNGVNQALFARAYDVLEDDVTFFGVTEMLLDSRMRMAAFCEYSQPARFQESDHCPRTPELHPWAASMRDSNTYFTLTHESTSRSSWALKERECARIHDELYHQAVTSMGRLVIPFGEQTGVLTWNESVRMRVQLQFRDNRPAVWVELLPSQIRDALTSIRGRPLASLSEGQRMLIYYYRNGILLALKNEKGILADRKRRIQSAQSPLSDDYSQALALIETRLQDVQRRLNLAITMRNEAFVAVTSDMWRGRNRTGDAPADLPQYPSCITGQNTTHGLNLQRHSIDH